MARCNGESSIPLKNTEIDGETGDGKVPLTDTMVHLYLLFICTTLIYGCPLNTLYIMTRKVFFVAIFPENVYVPLISPLVNYPSDVVTKIAPFISQ